MPTPIDSTSKEYRRWWSEYSAYSICYNEFCSRAAQAIAALPKQKLLAWNPYGDERLLYATRLASLSTISMILVDLDGYEPPPHADLSLERKGELISLVNEARNSIVNGLLALPEVLIVANGDKSKEQLSVGGYGDSGVSLYLDIPQTIIDELSIPELSPGKLATNYWLLDEGIERLEELVQSKGAQSRSSLLTQLICEAYSRKYSDGTASSIKRWDGERTTCPVDEDLQKLNTELAEELLGYLLQIESLHPLYKTSFAQLANICYDIAHLPQDDRPDWAR